MVDTTSHTTAFRKESDQLEFSFLERAILRRFHPVSLLFDVIGLIWVTYFLWLNNWQNALAVIFVERLLATSIVWRIDFKAMAQTPLGKLGLLHIHPWNFVLQIVGIIVLIWALWIHSTLYILAGLSVLLIGHVFGWSQVNPSYSLNEKETT